MQRQGMAGGPGRGRGCGRGRTAWSPLPQTPPPPPVIADQQLSATGTGASNSWPIKDARKTTHHNSPSDSPDSGIFLSHVSTKLTTSDTHPHLPDDDRNNNSPTNTSTEQQQHHPFDICPPKPTTSVVLKPSLLHKNRELRNQIKRTNNMDTPNATLLRPGMLLFKSYLSITQQVNIVKRIRDLGIGSGGFYQFNYGEATKLHLKLMCLGKNWDPLAKQYTECRAFDGAKPPAIPLEFHHLVDKAIQDSHAVIQQNSKTTNPDRILPSMSSDICIVNFYSQNGRLGLHQDKDESEESLHQGLPVVSFSIGDSADFLYGDERDADKAQKVVLESGDVLVFGGKSRHVFHGVASIHPTTAPKLLLEETNLRPGRLNLTFRQY